MNRILHHLEQRVESDKMLGHPARAPPAAAEKLEHLAASHTTWHEWRERHPQSLVLSLDTGYTRDYRKSPYRGY